jgi:hypothetical protein
MNYKKMGIKKALEHGNEEMIKGLYLNDKAEFWHTYILLNYYEKQRIEEILHDYKEELKNGFLHEFNCI